jgi:hypothetical protein
MEIDFDQVRAAAHDDITAKILRKKWMLDDRSSASGEVFCSRADIERLLANGQLEPVLSVEQFVRISHGKAYGAAGPTAPAQSTSSAEPHGATDGTTWAHHPDWAEFQRLSEPIKAAVRHDFPTFLFLKRRGALASLAETVGSQIERDVAARSIDAARRAHEQSVEHAADREPERFAAAMAWAKGKKSYPRLQQKKAR